MSPGHRAVDLDVLAALQHEQVPDLERLAPVADEELRVLGHRALVHAEDAELADERVDDDLEHVREHVLGRVRLGAELLGRIALALVEQRRVALGRVRRELDEHVEQLGDAGAGARGDEAHRDEVALAQRLLERRVQLLGRDLVALLEVLAPSAPRRPRPPGRPAPGARRRPTRSRHRRTGLKKQSTTRLPPSAGRLIGRHSLPNAAWIGGEHLRQVDVLGVDLVDDDEAAELALRRPVHHPRRDHLDAGLRVDDDGRGLDRVERADRLADEVGKPGRVDRGGSRVSCVSRCSTDARSECWYVFSSGSKSLTVVPRSTVPASLMAPAFSSRASASVVLPEAPWPTSATVRMFWWRSSPCSFPPSSRFRECIPRAARGANEPGQGPLAVPPRNRRPRGRGTAGTGRQEATRSHRRRRRPHCAYQSTARKWKVLPATTKRCQMKWP